jgi:hypothetical protein
MLLFTWMGRDFGPWWDRVRQVRDADGHDASSAKTGVRMVLNDLEEYLPEFVAQNREGIVARPQDTAILERFVDREGEILQSLASFVRVRGSDSHVLNAYAGCAARFVHPETGAQLLFSCEQGADNLLIVIHGLRADNTLVRSVTLVTKLTESAESPIVIQHTILGTNNRASGDDR